MFPTEEINGCGVDRKRFLVVPRCAAFQLLLCHINYSIMC